MAKSKEILRHPYIRVGRLKMNIAKAAHLKSADIYVSENYLKHIEKKHSTELKTLGIDPYSYVKLIVDNFNQIRRGSDDSVLLVIFREENYHDVAAIKLTYIETKGFWEVKTAQPRNSKDVIKRKLLW